MAFANILRGVPIDADGEYVGGFFNLLNPYALLGGLTTLLLFLTHGAMFVSLKTDGADPARAPGRWPCKVGPRPPPSSRWCSWSGPRSMTGTVGLRGRVRAGRGRAGRPAWSALRPGREGWALPRHLRRHRPGGGRAVRRAVPGRDADLACATGIDLTTTNASATTYTLKIMTVVAVIFTPLVLLYQGWTYWVFRKRIAVHHIPDPSSRPRPADEADRPAAAPASSRPRAAPLAGVLGAGVAGSLLVIAQAWAVTGLVAGRARRRRRPPVGLAVLAVARRPGR